jgi:hypothetical protein
MLTFRSAAAGFFDLEHDGGTGNFGGFRTGCTANLIPADGVLNAPDYTRTCTCSYQNQCSLALVHMPDVEMWTFNSIASSKAPVEKLGINFGAPGDRRDQAGTLWLDYPSVGGPSPDVPVKVEGDSVEYLRAHAWTLTYHDPPWIFASGVKGARRVQVQLAGADEVNGNSRSYRVRIYLRLANPASKPDQFGVRVQGQSDDLSHIPLSDWQRGIVREYRQIDVGSQLELEWEGETSNQEAVILCGVEVLRDASRP